MNQVQNQANMASSEKVDTGEHILIHHSRNTAQKQWAETQVIQSRYIMYIIFIHFLFLLCIVGFSIVWCSSSVPYKAHGFARLRWFCEGVGCAVRLYTKFRTVPKSRGVRRSFEVVSRSPADETLPRRGSRTRSLLTVLAGLGAYSSRGFERRFLCVYF